MAFADFLVLVLQADLVEELVGPFSRDIGDVRRTSLGHHELLAVLVDDGRVGPDVESLGLLLDVDAGVEAAGEAPYVAELVRILEDDLEGLDAAHRKAGHGPVVLVRQDPVVGLDEGDDVVHQVLLEHRDVAGAVGHHDDHRDHLALGKEVVEDVAGAADGRPGDVSVAAAVDEVEDGKLRLAGLVPRRGPDPHRPRAAERLAPVGADCDGAMRDVGVVGEEFLSAGIHYGQSSVLRGRGALRVIDLDAVHHEVVPVRAGLDVRDAEGPDAVPLDGNNLLAPGHHVACKADGPRLGGVDAENGRAVGKHPDAPEGVVGGDPSLRLLRIGAE